MDLTRVNEIIDKYHAAKSSLIGIFQDIQAEYRYLPKEAISRVVERLGIPLTQAYMVATFYKSLFSLVPRGEHEIHVCLGTACQPPFPLVTAMTRVVFCLLVLPAGMTSIMTSVLQG